MAKKAKPIDIEKVIIIKKDRTRESFTPSKIERAVRLAADRTPNGITNSEVENVCTYVKKEIQNIGKYEIPIKTMHALVERGLELVNPEVGKSYRNYRDFKASFVNTLNNVYLKAQQLRYSNDVSNANTDSALVATKRSVTANYLNEELYRAFYMTPEERQACKDGFIYIHDQSARADTINCCLSRIDKILDGGFEMGNVWYTEPKTLETAFDVISDIILSAASQQYGGFTVPQFDKIIAKYAERSYRKYLEKYITRTEEIVNRKLTDTEMADMENWAYNDVVTDMMQGCQGLEMKLNTVGSSRGDYPFVTFTFGLGTSKWEIVASQSILKTRLRGQGKPGFKKPVLFPKLVFLYDDQLHGKGKPLRFLFELAVKTTANTMLPDYLSLTGDGYVADMYKKYGTPISPMGCRAFLSPWYEEGGLEKASERDKPVFDGRFNIGAVTLNLPLIYKYAQMNELSFFEEIDKYMEIIRRLHIRTRDYLGELKASCNPLQYCYGGLLGGNLNPDDKIRPMLDSATASFGFIGLNEVQQLYNQHSLVEDQEFAKKTLQHIADKIQEFKEQDKILYALYGTPAESLAGKALQKFREMYGIIHNVSDRDYFTNSFHAHVSEDITPFEKQDCEYDMFHISNGGHIQYVRVVDPTNLEALTQIIERGMEMGFYQGINFQNCYCADCGSSFIDQPECPECGSKNVTVFDRVCGYLGYTKVDGRTRINKSKLSEIKDRISM